MSKHNVTKNLFIGLGGTGSSTLIQVKREIIKKYGQMPPMIDFLIMDTDADVNNVSYDLDSEMGKFSPSEILHIPIERPDRIKGTPRIKKWLSEHVEKKVVASSQGAKQIRSLGRFAFFQNYNRINEKINNKIDSINSIAHKKDPKFESTGKTLIHLVFSPCGGTGAGTFLDTAITVKDSNPELTVYAWMVMPEFFKSFENTDKVGQNAYAALKEIDHMMGKDASKDTPWSNYGENPYTVNYSQSKTVDPEPFFIFDRIHLFDKVMFDGMSTIVDIDDVKDRIARTLLLHVTADAGNKLFSTYNNDDSYEIPSGELLNFKRRNYASTGYSEIILDRDFLKNYRKNKAYNILIDSLSHNESNNSKNMCKDFIDNNNLREDNGHDDVIDRLFPMREIRYSVETVQPGDIGDTPNIIIKENCSIQLNNLKTLTTNRCTREKEALTGEFSTKLKEMIKSLYQTNGGLVTEKSFLNCLVGSFSAMRSEMAEEQQQHQKSIQKIEKELKNYEENIIGAADSWIGRRGKVRDECVLYAEKYKSRLLNEAELIRKKAAEEFYTFAISQIQTIQNKRDNFSKLIADFDIATNEELQKMDNEKGGVAGNGFEIYIHNHCAGLLTDTVKLSAVEATKSIDFNMLKDASSISEIRIAIDDYLDNSDYILEIDKLNLEELLESLPKDKKKEIMRTLNDLAQSAINLDKSFLVDSGKTEMEALGVLVVENSKKSIFKKDSEYAKYWGNAEDDLVLGGTCKVASSYDADRIKLLKVMGSFPAAAIEGIKQTKNEFESSRSYHYCDKYFEGAMDLIDGAPDEEISNSFALAAAMDLIKLERGALKFFDKSGGRPAQIVSGSRGKNDRAEAFKCYSKNKNWINIQVEELKKIIEEQGKPKVEGLLKAHFDRLKTPDYLGKSLDNMDPESDEAKQIYNERKTIKKYAREYPIDGASEWV